MNPCHHPIVILRDITENDLGSILKFMYHGEVQVGKDRLKDFLKTAETLQVKGLAEGSAKPVLADEEVNQVGNEVNQMGNELNQVGNEVSNEERLMLRRRRLVRRKTNNEDDPGETTITTKCQKAPYTVSFCSCL